MLFTAQKKYAFLIILCTPLGIKSMMVVKEAATVGKCASETSLSNGTCLIPQIVPSCKLSEQNAMTSKVGALSFLKKVIAAHRGIERLPYKVQLAPYALVSETQIITFMNSLGYDLRQRWASILDPEEIKENKLTERFLKEAERIAADINNLGKIGQYWETFKSGSISAMTFYDTLEPLLSKTLHVSKQEVRNIVESVRSGDKNFADTTLQELIKNTRESGCFLSVRPTDELQDTLSRLHKKDAYDHGRNTELASPNDLGLMQKLLTLIASSFKREALNARAQANDPHLFDLPPFSMIVRKYEGVKLDGTYTLACQASTREVRGFTPGMTLAQCDFGITDLGARADTYYAHNNHLSSVVYYKFMLNIRSRDGSIELIGDDNAPLSEQILPEEAQQSLHQLLLFLEEEYHCPLILEVTINQQTKVMTIVDIQAGVSTDTQNRAEYLDMQHLKHVSSPIEIQSCLYDAGGEVRLITHKDQVMVSRTLQQAVQELLLNRYAAKNVQIIAVQHAESSMLAQNVIKLREMGKAVIVLERHSFDRLEGFLDYTYPLIFDMQHNTIVAVFNYDVTKEYLYKTGAIKQGRLHHPLPKRLTIKQNLVLNDSLCKNFASLEDPFAKQTLEELIELIKIEPLQDAQTALTALLTRLATVLLSKKEQATATELRLSQKRSYASRLIDFTKSQISQTPSFFEPEIEMLTALFNQALELAPALRPTLTLPSRDVARLAQVRFLEALLFQNPIFFMMGSFSLQSVLKEFEQKMAFLETLERLITTGRIPTTLLSTGYRNNFLHAYAGFKEAANANEADAWISFIDRYARGTEQERNTLRKELDEPANKSLYTILSRIYRW